MAQWILRFLGILELVIAGILLTLVFQLPGSSEIKDRVDRAETVGTRLGQEVKRVRTQLHGFSQRQPEMRQMTRQLEKQLALVSRHLNHQQVDFKTLEALRDALGDTANGVDGISKALDPKVVSQLGDVLHATALYLEEKVVPAAAKAAEQLDQSSEALQKDAERLTLLLRSLRTDRPAIRRTIHQLSNLDQGLDWLETQTKPSRLSVWREQVAGTEKSLTTGAERVEILGRQKIPSFSLLGNGPLFQERPLLPDAARMAKGLRQSAQVLGLVNRYLGSLAEHSSQTESILKELRKGVFSTRQVFETMLHQHAQMEPLVRDMPDNAARLAEQLPQISRGLAQVLREVGRLREVIGTLRQAEKGITNVVNDWPQLQQRLGRSVIILRTARSQINYALDHRDEYQLALEQVALLAKTIATSLPVLTSQVEADLAEQDQSLDGLQTSIEDVTRLLPATGRTANRVVQLSRLLLGLLAGVFGLHAIYLLTAGRLTSLQARHSLNGQPNGSPTSQKWAEQTGKLSSA
jgi:chromosome segregation ATPase